MIPVLDNAGMREADRITIEELGLPSLVLMEAAAGAVTEVVVERFAQLGRVVVLCGPGNNGGDGLAVARQLRCRGIDVDAGLLVAPGALKDDAARQLELAHAFGVPVRECAGDLQAFDAVLAGSDVIVDALFGTGLDRPLSAAWVEVVRRINGRGVPVVAVDIPSGLAGGTAAVSGEAVEAAVTVTFAAPKVAHVLPPACWRCGEVAVGEIGIPPWVLDGQASLGLLEAEDVAGWLPRRPVDAHKGAFGHLVVIAGSVGRAGAAALAARAGVLSGAGLVTVATAGGAVWPIQASVPEAMVDPLPVDAAGAITGEGLDALLDKASAIAVGPGLGLGEGPARLLASLLERWRGPLLLDADALTLLAGHPEALAGRGTPTVVTPHPGELARLLGTTTAAVVGDRLGAARQLARLAGTTVLAKGARTIVAEPDGRAVVNPTGSAGLASGGAGDVLTGVIGALLAQGLPGLEAAASGAYLHGRAAEILGEQYAGAVPASAVASSLPGAERELRELA
jgi:ADP-dependent NAD(P)H-hydrate dehydratase / NAD(P)H-hydrate epimerase